MNHMDYHYYENELKISIQKFKFICDEIERNKLIGDKKESFN